MSTKFAKKNKKLECKIIIFLNFFFWKDISQKKKKTCITLTLNVYNLKNKKKIKKNNVYL
jgi:hypothetical protein